MKPWINSRGGPEPAHQHFQVTPSSVMLRSSAPGIRATSGTVSICWVVCSSCIFVQPIARSGNQNNFNRLCRFYGELKSPRFFVSCDNFLILNAFHCWRSNVGAVSTVIAFAEDQGLFCLAVILGAKGVKKAGQLASWARGATIPSEYEVSRR